MRQASSGSASSVLNQIRQGRREAHVSWNGRDVVDLLSPGIVGILTVNPENGQSPPASDDYGDQEVVVGVLRGCQSCGERQGFDWSCFNSGLPSIVKSMRKMRCEKLLLLRGFLFLIRFLVLILTLISSIPSHGTLYDPDIDLIIQFFSTVDYPKSAMTYNNKSPNSNHPGCKNILFRVRYYHIRCKKRHMEHFLGYFLGIRRGRNWNPSQETIQPRRKGFGRVDDGSSPFLALSTLHLVLSLRVRLFRRLRVWRSLPRITMYTSLWEVWEEASGVDVRCNPRDSRNVGWQE